MFFGQRTNNIIRSYFEDERWADLNKRISKRTNPNYYALDAVGLPIRQRFEQLTPLRRGRPIDIYAWQRINNQFYSWAVNPQLIATHTPERLRELALAEVNKHYANKYNEYIGRMTECGGDEDEPGKEDE